MNKNVKVGIVAVLVATLGMLFLFTPHFAAQEWKAIVLKASSFKDDGSGNLIIMLASGATIQVPKADWSSQWSKAMLSTPYTGSGKV